MAPLISHQGLFTGKGLPVSFAAGAKGVLNAPGSYTHFNKLAMATANQGEADLADGSAPALGVIVDCSPKGDTGTIETAGYEWVQSDAAYAVGDILTSGAGGQLVACATAGFPSAAEVRAGAFVVDQVKNDGTNDLVLVRLDARVAGVVSP